MSIDRRAGFTLIELIVFIVIVSAALAGVLTAYNVAVRGSADPLRQKQALAVAESMLEEVLAKNFANPSGGYTPTACPVLGTACDRAKFDNVGDYAGYQTTGIRDLTDSATVVLGGYNLAVQVTQPSAAFQVSGGADVAADQVRVATVTVTDAQSGNSYVLSGYRFNND